MPRFINILEIGEITFPFPCLSTSRAKLALRQLRRIVRFFSSHSGSTESPLPSLHAFPPKLFLIAKPSLERAFVASTKSRDIVDFIVNKLAIPRLRRLHPPVFIHRLTFHYSVERSIFGHCFSYCRSIYSADLRTSEKRLDLSFLPGLCFFLSTFTLFLSSLAARS